jgi:hypothetical protein
MAKKLIISGHIVPRRGILKRFKNGWVKFFLKLFFLIEIIYIKMKKTFEEIILYKLFYRSWRFTLRRNIYFIQKINILKIYLFF